MSIKDIFKRKPTQVNCPAIDDLVDLIRRIAPPCHFCGGAGTTTDHRSTITTCPRCTGSGLGRIMNAR